MAKTKVQDGDVIQMIASMAGEYVSWAPDQVLVVGTDIDENTASALVNLPEDEGRARLLSPEEGARLLAIQRVPDPDTPAPVHEVPRESETSAGKQQQEEEAGGEEPSGQETTSSGQEDSSGDGDADKEGEVRSADNQEKQETSSAEAGMETATAPEAETRETATQPRRRKRVKPPAEAEKDQPK